MLPGNHDPAMPPCLFDRAGITALPGVHVLGVTDDVAVHFPALDLEVWGHAHLDHSNMAPLRGPRPRNTRWQVALAHGHYVEPAETAANAHRSWLIDDAAIAATGADYIALGHWDRPARVGCGAVPAYYSGSPDLAHSVNRIVLAESGVAVDRHRIAVPSQRVLSPAGRPVPG
jgi:DNA repair exonuclease SbcCD nuclease subunit